MIDEQTRARNEAAVRAYAEITKALSEAAVAMMPGLRRMGEALQALDLAVRANTPQDEVAAELLALRFRVRCQLRQERDRRALEIPKREASGTGSA